jgi:hypothetical protein
MKGGVQPKPGSLPLAVPTRIMRSQRIIVQNLMEPLSDLTALLQDGYDLVSLMKLA